MPDSADGVESKAKITCFTSFLKNAAPATQGLECEHRKYHEIKLDHQSQEGNSKTELEMSTVKGLRDRLKDGENVVCAEGYMWELERRGFVCSGDFTPEVVLDYPERVRALHEEFVLAGSDVVEAFTYYAHEGKLKTIGREADFEGLNRSSLKMAREIATQSGTLMAGNICNSTTFESSDAESVVQIEWAVEGGADYIIAETFNELAEAKLALQAIQEYGNEEAGADVVGLNCARGPETIMPVMREARRVCKGPLAALPACFRTNERENCYYRLTDPRNGKALFPDNLGCVQSSRGDIRNFAEEALQLGIQYIGLCCGATPSLLREVAQVYGRKPELSRFAPNTSRNYYMKNNLSARERKIKQLLFGDIGHCADVCQLSDNEAWVATVGQPEKTTCGGIVPELLGSALTYAPRETLRPERPNVPRKTQADFEVPLIFPPPKPCVRHVYDIALSVSVTFQPVKSPECLFRWSSTDRAR
ncbi:betaine--homocysteine s-methyltransferase 1-like [Plakobranchus ocellatus]|uniref:Betaine--homocysteine s-methyltransferase 1-like n=1 Tax=Plakobranchus ocellatus TaxID=259542 RepID=A0AAV4BMY1_9GAST|nr:betaine--homocysteine s-methyltransferase 1-like [Plakobranchus ocellatus]